jgi:branched-chain amino acid transport system substrate-binding protein
MNVSKLKKQVLVVFAAMAVVTMLAGCGGDAAKSDTIKLGANVELTGNSAAYGASAKHGIDLAVKQLNDQGGLLGKKITVSYADNKSEPAEAANAMQKLIDDKVIGILGPDTSSNVLAGVNIIEKEKIPLITPFGTNPDITVDPATKKVRDYAFRTAFIDTFQGKVIASFVTKTLKAKNVAIYIDNSSDYSKGLAKFFKEDFEKNGGKVVAEEAYLQKDTDFKSALTKIAATNPDAIFVPGYYQEVGMIIKQAREMGMQQPIIGGDGWDSAKLVEIAGGANLGNTFFSTHYSMEDKSPNVVKFVADYQKEYNEPADAPSALAYDSVMMFAQAIKDANSLDPSKIRDALAKLKDFDGITGKITFDANHDPLKSAVMMTYKDGKATFVGKVEP